jgi:hypothetical protein
MSQRVKNQQVNESKNQRVKKVTVEQYSCQPAKHSDGQPVTLSQLSNITTVNFVKQSIRQTVKQSYSLTPNLEVNLKSL